MAGLHVNAASSIKLFPLSILPQGKYINDAQVLREIAREAQLEDPDRVADDPTCCAKEVVAELKYQEWTFGRIGFCMHIFSGNMGWKVFPLVLRMICGKLLDAMAHHTACLEHLYDSQLSDKRLTTGALKLQYTRLSLLPCNAGAI